MSEEQSHEDPKLIARPHAIKHIPEEVRREIYEFILNDLACGFIDQEIRRRVREKFDVAYNTAVKYISRVRGQIRKNKDAIQKDKDLNLSMAIIRLETLYRKALEVGKLNVAESALKQLHALQGLAPQANSYIQINNSQPAGYIDQEDIREVPNKVLEAQFSNKKLPAPLVEPKRIPTTVTSDYVAELLKGGED